jgi:hypothetical protein
MHTKFAAINIEVRPMMMRMGMFTRAWAAFRELR